MGKVLVLVHPGQDVDDLGSTRLVRVEVPPGDYSWRRITGDPAKVPPWGTPDEKLISAGWQAQSMKDLGKVLGEDA